MLHHKQTFYHLKEKAYFLFAICSKSPQRNSIFIRYNKGAVREDHSERAPPKNLQTQARMIAANAAPLKQIKISAYSNKAQKRHGTFCSVPFGVLGKRSAQVAQAVGGKMGFQGFPSGVEAVVP